LKFNVRLLAVVALLAFSAGALFIAACGDDDDTNGASAQVDETEFEALQEQTTRTAILAAMTVFRVDAMHELDEEVSAATEVDAGWEGRVTRMKRATASVDWPEDMQAMADTLLEKLTALEAALKDENLDEAKTLTPEAHDAWHELDHDASAFAGREDHEEDDGGHAEGENSPAASEAAGH
jgi:hypothetical protein